MTMPWGIWDQNENTWVVAENVKMYITRSLSVKDVSDQDIIAIPFQRQKKMQGNQKTL